MERQIVWAGVVIWMAIVQGLAGAQVTTGMILGTVTDSSGAVIAGANVTSKNLDTGFSRSVVTDASGTPLRAGGGGGGFQIGNMWDYRKSEEGALDQDARHT